MMSLSATDIIDGISLPSVTPDDLAAFHALHFPSTIPLTAVEDEYADNVDYETYPDGTIRTLTDEQIEIFRHSEIQQFLATKRRADEAAAEKASLEDEGEVSEPEPRVDAQESNDTEDVVDGDKVDVDEEAEYRAYLERERQELLSAQAEPIAVVAPPQFTHSNTQTERDEPPTKKVKARRPGRFNERAISTRRKVRELDEIQAENMELDY